VSPRGKKLSGPSEENVAREYNAGKEKGRMREDHASRNRAEWRYELMNDPARGGKDKDAPQEGERTNKNTF